MYFYINFSTKDNLFAALDALKKSPGPFKWVDSMEEETKDIIVRKNKSIEQRNTGKSNKHFYEVVKAVLKDGKYADTKLALINKKLLMPVDDDFMELMKFEETFDADKYKVTPRLDNFKNIGIGAATVESLVVVAAAAARKE